MVTRLIEIEEAIDALDAAIEYKNESIFHKQEDIRKSVSISKVWLLSRNIGHDYLL